jgi:hypothetical protein
VLQGIAQEVVHRRSQPLRVAMNFRQAAVQGQFHRETGALHLAATGIDGFFDEALQIHHAAHGLTQTRPDAGVLQRLFHHFVQPAALLMDEFAILPDAISAFDQAISLIARQQRDGGDGRPQLMRYAGDELHLLIGHPLDAARGHYQKDDRRQKQRFHSKAQQQIAATILLERGCERQPLARRSQFPDSRSEQRRHAYRGVSADGGFHALHNHQAARLGALWLGRQLRMREVGGNYRKERCPDVCPRASAVQDGVRPTARCHSEIIVGGRGFTKTASDQLRKELAPEIVQVDRSHKALAGVGAHGTQDANVLGVGFDCIEDGFQGNHHSGRLFERDIGTVKRPRPLRKRHRIEAAVGGSFSHCCFTRFRDIGIVEIGEQLGKGWDWPTGAYIGRGLILQKFLGAPDGVVELIGEQGRCRIQVLFFALLIGGRDARRPAVLHDAQCSHQERKHAADRHHLPHQLTGILASPAYRLQACGMVTIPLPPLDDLNILNPTTSPRVLTLLKRPAFLPPL